MQAQIISLLRRVGRASQVSQALGLLAQIFACVGPLRQWMQQTHGGTRTNQPNQQPQTAETQTKGKQTRANRTQRTHTNRGRQDQAAPTGRGRPRVETEGRALFKQCAASASYKILASHPPPFRSRVGGRCKCMKVFSTHLKFKY